MDDPSAGPIGPWPARPPWPRDTIAAVCLDGGIASATLACWLTAGGQPWRALCVAAPGAPARALEAARAIAGERPRVEVALGAALAAPAGWAIAAQAARALEASWLALAPRETDGEPMPLRLAAAEAALQADGFGGLYAPLWGHDAPRLGRLALALGVPFEHTWDCEAEVRCGECSGCRERARLFRALGRPDPLAADVTFQ